MAGEPSGRPIACEIEVANRASSRRPQVVHANAGRKSSQPFLDDQRMKHSGITGRREEIPQILESCLQELVLRAPDVIVRAAQHKGIVGFAIACSFPTVEQPLNGRLAQARKLEVRDMTVEPDVNRNNGGGPKREDVREIGLCTKGPQAEGCEESRAMARR